MPASYARALLRAVSEQGYDAEQFLQVEGLTLSTVEASRELPTALFGRLYQRAMLLLKDESLGMVSGGPIASGTFRMMCLCVIHTPTLAAIVIRAGEFFDVCNGVAVKPQIVETGATAGICFATVRDQKERTVEDILEQEGPLRVRTSLYMWHSLLCWFAGRRVPLLRVEFGFAMPPNGALWTQLFRCPVEFNCRQSLVRFDRDVLELPNVQTEQSLSVFLKSAPHRLIAPSYEEQRLSDRVLALFGDDLSRKLPGADLVSRQLGLSISTLRRRLLEEGKSFQGLKDECRHAAAIQYLASTDLTFNEIAGLLGFDEVSAFYRSFRRWTDTTPTQYRASL